MLCVIWKGNAVRLFHLPRRKMTANQSQGTLCCPVNCYHAKPQPSPPNPSLFLIFPKKIIYTRTTSNDKTKFMMRKKKKSIINHNSIKNTLYQMEQARKFHWSSLDINSITHVLQLTITNFIIWLYKLLLYLSFHIQWSFFFFPISFLNNQYSNIERDHKSKYPLPFLLSTQTSEQRSK